MEEASTGNESRFRALQRWNLAMCVLHLGQAAAVFVLSNDTTVTITTSFLQWLPGADAPASVTEPLYDLRVAPLVGVFLLISAAAHLIMASPFTFGWYVRNLKKEINYVRWYEYSLSASLMVVLIGILSGVLDAPNLIMLFALTATMNLFGLVMEKQNQTTVKTDWTSFIFGSIAGIVPWGIIAWYFFSALASSTEAVPTFVYFILATLFVLFLAFPINMILQYKKVGPWKDYLVGEKGYMILSLVAKSALAWQVFGGILNAPTVAGVP